MADAAALAQLTPAAPKPAPVPDAILDEQLLAGLPNFRLDPQKPPKHGGDVIGLDTLHLVWDV